MSAKVGCFKVDVAEICPTRVGSNSEALYRGLLEVLGLHLGLARFSKLLVQRFLLFLKQRWLRVVVVEEPLERVEVPLGLSGLYINYFAGAFALDRMGGKVAEVPDAVNCPRQVRWESRHGFVDFTTQVAVLNSSLVA